MISLLVNSGRLFPMSLVLTILCTFLRPCDVDQGTNVSGVLQIRTIFLLPERYAVSDIDHSLRCHVLTTDSSPCPIPEKGGRWFDCSPSLSDFPRLRYGFSLIIEGEAVQNGSLDLRCYAAIICTLRIILCTCTRESHF